MDAIGAIRQVLSLRPDVRVAYVFGSVARGEQRASSDVDVAVLFAPAPQPRELDDLSTELERAVSRRVDLVVLNTAPPLLAHQVISTGHLIVVRHDDERADFEIRTLRRYMDTAHLRRVQHQYLRERAEAFRARAS